MPKALLTLMRLQFRGTIRRLFRGLKTPKGALYFVVGAAMVCLWILPGIVMGITARRSNPEITRALVPAGMLVFCVLSVATSAGEKVFYFTPAEVDFLFSGPFTRRELLCYKILKNVSAAALMAFIFSIAFLQHVTYWVAAFPGILLAFVAIQFISMALILAGQALSERIYGRARKVILGVFVLALVSSAFHIFNSRPELPPAEFMRLMQQAPMLHWLMLPFIPFARVIAAQSIFPELLGWLPAALAIDLALLFVILRLETDYREAVLAASQRIHAKLQRVQKGAGIMAIGGNKQPSWRLPLFPWLGGAGPIAWKQCTKALRSAKGLILLVLIIALSLAPAVVVVGARGGIEKETSGILLAVLAGATIYLSMFVPFDFRTEIENMEWLKVLPLRPVALASGELLASVFLMTFLQLTVIGAAMIAAGPQPLLLAAASFALPMNLILFGAENFLFLLFPARVAGAGAGDFQQMGRLMIWMVLKLLLLSVCFGIATAAGAVAYFVFGGSLAAGIAVSWLTLACLVLVILKLLGWAFVKFDVSIDTPA